MTTKVSVRGPIVGDDEGWFYELFGAQCACPSAVRRQIEAAPEGDMVVVEINSPGGDVAAGAEIYETIRQCPNPVECHVLGAAASSASFIACAAPSTISPMGFLFLHNCSTAVSGNRHDLESGRQMLESIDSNIMRAYRAKTGMSDEDLYALMDAETTIDAERAVELGFIDRLADAPAGRSQAAQAAPLEGIAAFAPGYPDPRKLGDRQLGALRDAYEKLKEDTAEGGQAMAKLDPKALAALVADEDPKKDDPEETDPEEGPGKGDGGSAETDPEEKPGEGSGDEPEEDVPMEGDDPDEGGSQGDPEKDPEKDPGEGPEEGSDDPDEEDPDEDPDKKGATDEFARGVRAERARVAEILDIAGSVPDDMLRDALFGHPRTADSLALDALKAGAGKGARYIAAAKRDARASGAGRVASPVRAGAGNGEQDGLVAAMRSQISGKKHR